MNKIILKATANYECNKIAVALKLCTQPQNNFGLECMGRKKLSVIKCFWGLAIWDVEYLVASIAEIQPNNQRAKTMETTRNVLWGMATEWNQLQLWNFRHFDVLKLCEVSRCYIPTNLANQPLKL